MLVVATRKSHCCMCARSGTTLTIKTDQTNKGRRCIVIPGPRIFVSANAPLDNSTIQLCAPYVSVEVYNEPHT